MATNNISVRSVVTVKLTAVGFLKNIGLSQGFDGISDLLFSNALHLELVSCSGDNNPKLGMTMDKEPIEAPAKLNILINHEEDETKYEAKFQVSENFGEVGAILVTNEHHKEMYLKDIVLEGLPQGLVKVICNSWVHSKHDNPEKRIFFTNKVYLPSQTPSGLRSLRDKELENLRGNGEGERKAYDRIYDYDTYNDLGNPDKEIQLLRPVLGSNEHPYPRRCRTGRPPTKAELEVTPQASGTEVIKRFLELPEEERFYQKPVIAQIPADSSMASGTARVMTDDEMMLRASKRRKQQGGTGSSETQSYTVEESMKPPKPKAQKSIAVVNVDDVSISLPADFLAAEGVDNGVWPEAEKLLFPTAHHRLQTLDAESILNQGVEHQLQGLQNALASRAFVRKINSEVRDASRKMEKQENEIKNLRRKLASFDESKKKALADQKDRFDKEYAVKVEELTAKAEEVAAKDKEITHLNKRVEELLEEVLDVVAASTIKGKAKMAYEVYFDGATKEDCKVVMDKYLEHVGDMADLLPPNKDVTKKVTDFTADSAEKKEDTAAPDAANADEVIEENK